MWTFYISLKRQMVKKQGALHEKLGRVANAKQLKMERAQKEKKR